MIHRGFYGFLMKVHDLFGFTFILMGLVFIICVILNDSLVFDVFWCDFTFQIETENFFSNQEISRNELDHWKPVHSNQTHFEPLLVNDLSSFSIPDSSPKPSQRFDTNVNTLWIHYAPRSETRRRQSKTNYHHHRHINATNHRRYSLILSWFPFFHVQLSRNFVFFFIWLFD